LVGLATLEDAVAIAVAVQSPVSSSVCTICVISATLPPIAGIAKFWLCHRTVGGIVNDGKDLSAAGWNRGNCRSDDVTVWVGVDLSVNGFGHQHGSSGTVPARVLSGSPVGDDASRAARGQSVARRRNDPWTAAPISARAAGELGERLETRNWSVGGGWEERIGWEDRGGNRSRDRSGGRVWTDGTLWNETVPSHADGWVVGVQHTLAPHLIVHTGNGGGPAGNELRTGQTGEGLGGRALADGPDGVGVGVHWRSHGVRGDRWNLRKGNPLDVAREAIVGYAIAEGLDSGKIGRRHGSEGTHDGSVELLCAYHLVETEAHVADLEIARGNLFRVLGLAVVVVAADGAGPSHNREGCEEERFDGGTGSEHRCCVN